MAERPGVPGGGSLYSVAAISPSDAWAGGYTITDNGFENEDLILHWNGETWKRFRAPVRGS
jgi:hypothetical protein